MASPYPDGDREKVASKLPAPLQQALKIRAAELALDIQEAVEAGITAWRALSSPHDPDTVDTTGARSFSTWLPPGMYDDFKATCAERNVSYTQGLAQSVNVWLTVNPSPRQTTTIAVEPERKIVGNQKGGVGKTAVSAGIGQAYAEAGKRVLIVDFDPQGHLSEQLGVPQIEPEHDSLVSHMCGDSKGELRDLVVTIEDPRYGKRLNVLPACFDGFLLDAKIAVVATQKRGFQKEAALELALRPLETDYDVVIIDCPPSLGIAMDAALYYGRRRRDTPPGTSGVIIPVLAEDSSATAYGMLAQQIEDLCEDLSQEIDYLGLVVNLYDSRRGYVATSSLESWKAIGDPKVLAVIGDLKEQREAVRKRMPLLSYAPHSDQAEAMRQVARGATR
ncbi:ParA family protein [Streptomyces sp. SPB074]|uniref:ParA family protein n=1 Tax=Streptomyces sp. (strain SPB074) TaxID=465543 RepID=UPI00017FED9D|nr:ParA family protein [Streptomyces sp. SPB074]EDY46145.1 plasmid partitioning protein, ParA2 [Streptomyces sp. SPB074]